MKKASAPLNLKERALRNKRFRHVLRGHSDKKMQLVLMSLKPSQNIPRERHRRTTQFVFIVSGRGSVAIEGKRPMALKKGSAVVIPPNTFHEIVNVSAKKRLQLYTIYTPPVHH